jgi:hypothetical protein
MEAILLRHVIDWETLLFNRHGRLSRPGARETQLQPNDGWNYRFDPSPELPLTDSDGALSFVHTASSLVHTLLAHSALTGEERTAAWALRLASRYWDMRHKTTGLGGITFNVRDSGDKALQQYGDVLGDDIREWLLLTPLHHRQISFPLGLLVAAAEMPDDSEIRSRIITEVVPEWLAYHRYAYDSGDGLWYPISVDGTRLPHERMLADGYYQAQWWQPKASTGQVLHLAALAHRLHPTEETRAALYDVLEGVGLSSSGNQLVTTIAGDENYDAEVLYALLDLDRANPEARAAELAEVIAQRMLEHNRVNGLFVPDDQRIWASINTPIPLALLHVAAHGRGLQLPAPYPDSGYIHAPYRGIESANYGRTFDLHVFYSRTRSDPVLQVDPSTGR